MHLQPHCGAQSGRCPMFADEERTLRVVQNLSHYPAPIRTDIRTKKWLPQKTTGRSSWEHYCLTPLLCPQRPPQRQCHSMKADDTVPLCWAASWGNEAIALYAALHPQVSNTHLELLLSLSRALTNASPDTCFVGTH